MAIYSRGKKVKSIYVRGKLVSNVFSRGKSVYENYPRLLGYMYFYVLNSDGSEFGGMRFKKYLDFDRELNTEVIHYERDDFWGIENLTDEHNLALEFPEDCVVLINGLRMSTYNKKASLSGLEFANVSGFITTNQEWPEELDTTYTYIQPIYGLQLGTAVGFLTITNGYCIAGNNRDSRLNLSMQGSYSLSSLGVTSEGTYPVYAIATSTGIENQITIISCNTMTIQASPLFRHIGWLTKTGNTASVISLGTPISGSNFSKSATSPNIVVSGGLGTDTAGYQVSIDSSTTSCSTYINEAKKENFTTVYSKKHTVTKEYDFTFVQFSNQANVDSSVPNNYYLKGPCDFKFEAYGWGTHTTKYYLSCTVGATNKSFSNRIENQYWPSGATSISVKGTLNADESAYSYSTVLGFSETIDVIGSRTFSPTCAFYRIDYNEQILKLYRKITKDKDSAKVTYESVFLKTSEATPQSTPYVSYVLVGTVTAQAKTGTLSIS